MRTTLTLDDDLARRLREIARRSGDSFKAVVNDALRRGLEQAAKPQSRPPRFVVKPKACGFRVGIDPRKLNQLIDELETALPVLLTNPWGGSTKIVRPSPISSRSFGTGWCASGCLSFSLTGR